MAAAPPGKILAVLTEMFETVRAYLLGAGLADSARGAVNTNPKGEATRAFDAEAERLALDVALRRLGALRAFSEEQGELSLGDQPPRWTLVIDPCDGSNNFRRGVRATGFAVAVLPAAALLAACSNVTSGTIVSKTYMRGYDTYYQHCVSYTSNGACRASIPMPQHIPDRYTLTVRNAAGETGDVEVDQRTYDLARSGQHYP